MKLRSFAAIALTTLMLAGPARAARIKEIAAVEGFRENQLIGYGVVVGLNGTGDRRQTVFSTQTLTNLLERMGVSVSPTAIRVANVAAVMVTASLPPVARTGSHIDVTVSAMGDSSSLQGGTLLLCPLRAPDGQVYAVAQGSVALGGFAAGSQGSARTVNHPTAGRIPAGALVEKAAPTLPPMEKVMWQLHRADFTTAARMAEVINKQYAGAVTAKAENAGLVSVPVPQPYKGRETVFIAELETLNVDSDRVARIVVNERTGTIVMGQDVVIAPVSLLHGALTVEVQTELQVSQPSPMAQGSTTVVPQTTIQATEEKAKNLVLKKGTTVEQLAKALVSIGATPRDIIAILQGLRAAGALDAELEVI